METKPKPRTRSDVLSLKMKKFAYEYIAGKNAGNKTQSVLATYNIKNYNNANMYAAKLLKNPLVLAEIDRLMAKAGLSEELITQRIREGMDASLITSYKGRAYETGLPDQKIRHKFIDTAAKIMKMYPGKQVDNRSINVHMQVEKMPPQELAKLLKSMAQQIDVRSKTRARIAEHIEKKPGEQNL